jgi:subtilase family serine protease
VGNRGNAAWDGYIVVQGPGNAQGGFRGLRPGESKEATVPLHAGSSGQITVGNIYFRVDPDNIMRELNESNNQAGPFSVTFY